MNPKRFAMFSSSVVLLAVIVAVVALATFAPRAAPKRCRLLFGSTADTEVVIEIDGDRLLVRRGSGARTEQFGFTENELADGTAIDVRDVSSKARYTIWSVSRDQDNEPAPRDSLTIHVTIEDGQTRYEQYCDVELRGLSETLAVAHFHGPLTISLRTVNWRIPKSMRLVRGDKATDISAIIGTMDRDRGCWTAVETHRGEKSSFPDGIFPYVDIEFPPKLPGEPSPKRRFALDEFC